MSADSTYVLNVEMQQAFKRIAELEREVSVLRNNLMGLAAHCGGLEALKETTIQ